MGNHGYKGKKVLCLASGGGQQAPILSATGADVKVMDISTFIATRSIKLNVD